ncbi:MAG: hypothetical protein ABIN61_01535 [candidate division WOR-3 bacterium]
MKNRIYFVRKNNKELSVFLCVLGIIIRMVISSICVFKEKEAKYYFGRILGNLVGLLECF